jgi:hypothetical protein
VTVALVRNRDWERRCTREIAGALGVDIEPLIVFAERRADYFEGEYGHDFPSLDRNLEQEALDELADARNYVVWKLEAIHRGLAAGDVEQLQIALRHVALAFAALRA